MVCILGSKQLAFTHTSAEMSWVPFVSYAALITRPIYDTGHVPKKRLQRSHQTASDSFVHGSRLLFATALHNLRSVQSVSLRPVAASAGHQRATMS